MHRDLKLENILINDTGDINQIKLIDFGFATKCKAGGKLTTYCGTPCYMDPDLTRQKKYSGQAVDIWALGVILYQLLTGTVPFWGETEQEMFRKIQSGKFNYPSSKPLSKSAKLLLSEIFQVNQNSRIFAKEIIEHSWFKEDSVPAPESVETKSRSKSDHKEEARAAKAKMAKKNQRLVDAVKLTKQK